MLKRVDRVVLGSFILPLLITFGLTTFIFMMQFLWKYIDDFVGKGLETNLLLKLVALFALTIIPMALPLAILLAATMVIGNLGENNELTAYKSGGLSLLRIMGSLIIFTTFLSLSAFYFSNNILPNVHLKFFSLLYDIRKQKPALDIKEGVFYRAISGFAIKIKKKAPDNKTLYNIMVYDHSNGKGNESVVMADTGKVELSNTGEFLVLTLFNGKQYQDVKKRENNPDENMKSEQTIMSFKKWQKVFDLREFKMTRTDQNLFKSNYIMFNTQQLRQESDSLNKDIQKKYAEIKNTNSTYFSFLKDTLKKNDSFLTLNIERMNFKNVFTRYVTETALVNAKNNCNSVRSNMEMNANDLKFKQENYVNYVCEWYRKFSLSFACIVLLFVGCAMGAIVRKGGFGVPILIAVLYFVLFHVLNVIGEKLAKGLVIPPMFGMWLSTLVLLPLALFLTYKANKDSVLFRSEWYDKHFYKIAGFIKLATSFLRALVGA